MVCEVQLELKAKGLNKTFTYLIPKHLGFLKVGQRVIVPFGNRKVAGYVKKIHNQIPNYELKEIIDVIDKQVVIDEEMNMIIDYITEQTLCSRAKVTETVLPKAIQASKDKPLTRKEITIIKASVSTTELEAYLSNHKLGTKQKELLTNLITNNFIYAKDYSKSSLTKLINEGIIYLEQKVVNQINKQFKNYPKHDLNPEQKQVYQTIKSNLSTNHTYLIHGVTGSGKTEVYLHLIEDVLAQGKTAIVLVPEISLTPQIEARFIGRFKSGVVTLHSRMTNRERLEVWDRIKAGDIKVVIGPRSAIFAPFNNLGIIIIDEEHESSYKQNNNPRYHAIDIAKFRTKFHNIPLVLGSATPSLESMARAVKGVYQLLPIKLRVNQQLPEVILIDKNKTACQNQGLMSNQLLTAIQETLSRQEQVILFLNRRGFNTITSCINCGFTYKCPHCDITLTYHQKTGNLRCHYCGYAEFLEHTCKSCHEPALRKMGSGTERIETFIQETFEHARIIRMDQDTTTKKNAHADIINKLIDEEADILIGTQMIAKGLDLKKATLVGVINADLSLNIPDFRSAERTFQLLSQVAGRSGRDKLKGMVMIETFNPDHYVMQTTKNHDYNLFFKEEMHLRKVMKYPPYYYLTLIRVSSLNNDIAIQESNQIFQMLNSALNDEYTILGPSTALMYRINNLYRFQIIIKYRNDDKLNAVLNTINEKYLTNKHVIIDIDVNPTSI